MASFPGKGLQLIKPLKRRSRSPTTAHVPLHHASCRLYTITLVTTAALLCASIVWPPTIKAEAQHDHAYYDSIIAPRQSTYTENNVERACLRAYLKAHVITYYLKVMGLSALAGHTVKFGFAGSATVLCGLPGS